MEVKVKCKSIMLGAKSNVLVISDKLGPSYYLSCHLPFLYLQRDIEFSFYSIDVATVGNGDSSRTFEKIRKLTEKIRPQVVIFVRVQEDWALDVVQLLQSKKIKSIFFLDDNFFSLPTSSDPDITGRLKLIEESASTVKELIKSVDLVWCSTAHLLDEVSKFRKTQQFINIPYPPYFGEGWSSKKIKKVLRERRLTIGYYGSYLHRDDLSMIVPEVQRILKSDSTIDFEIFGNVGIVDGLKEFSDRVRHKKPVRGYLDFVRELGRTNWALSIAPLRNNEFNLSRSPIKYFESTAAGIPFLCSDIDVYSKFVKPAHGMVAGDTGWFEAISKLLNNREGLVKQLENSHEYCMREHGIEKNVLSYKESLSEYIGHSPVRFSNRVKHRIERIFNSDR